MNTSSLVQKVWNFCHTPARRWRGLWRLSGAADLSAVLKLAHEYAQEPYNRDTKIPKGLRLGQPHAPRGEPLEAHYLATLHRLGQGRHAGRDLFKAQNKIQDPAKLSRLVQMIDAESWISLDADTKGDLYEGLLQRTPRTPRAARASTSRRAC